MSNVDPDMHFPMEPQAQDIDLRLMQEQIQGFSTGNFFRRPVVAGSMLALTALALTACTPNPRNSGCDIYGAAACGPDLGNASDGIPDPGTSAAAESAPDKAEKFESDCGTLNEWSLGEKGLLGTVLKNLGDEGADYTHAEDKKTASWDTTKFDTDKIYDTRLIVRVEEGGRLVVEKRKRIGERVLDGYVTASLPNIDDATAGDFSDGHRLKEYFEAADSDDVVLDKAQFTSTPISPDGNTLDVTQQKQVALSPEYNQSGECTGYSAIGANTSDDQFAELAPIIENGYAKLGADVQ